MTERTTGEQVARLAESVNNRMRHRGSPYRYSANMDSGACNLYREAADDGSTVALVMRGTKSEVAHGLRMIATGLDDTRPGPVTWQVIDPRLDGVRLTLHLASSDPDHAAAIERAATATGVTIKRRDE